MSTQITAAPQPASQPARPGPKRADSVAWKALHTIASLRITVVLFVLSILLVFFGTWAQVDQGIWSVVNRYFRSMIVWIPLKVIFMYAGWAKPMFEEAWESFTIPFPGGWLLGGIMLVNLLAAHIVHFKLTWRRAGVLLIHAGLVIMMLSELVTGLYAIEGNMQIRVGRSANYIIHAHDPELAILSRSKTKGRDDVVTVPRQYLYTGSKIQDAKLPFDVEVVRFMRNSSVIEILDKNFQNPADQGFGTELQAIERPEVSGADTDQKIDIPSAYLTFTDRQSGKALGTYLLSADLYEPQTIKVGDREYELYLRFKRQYTDYTITLDRFDHKKFVGTATPKDFRSFVTLNDPKHDVKDYKVEIYMNHPLRYRGETFYQASFMPGDSGTVLQVVRNPGWLLPYISCLVVGVGMLVHFGLHLAHFINVRNAARAAS